MNAETKALWQQMADMTMERCVKKCKTTLGSCCNEHLCETALEDMKNAGETPPVKARAEDGKCLIPPCYRPLCTLHQCDINNIGFAMDDPEWTERYFELREKLNEVTDL